MRKKYITLLLSAVLAFSLLNGCGGADKGTRNHAQEFRNEENAVYGEVSKITEDSVTIKVGTQKKNAQPDENSSMLDLTGEEKEIQITENTIIKRRTMEGRGRKMSENEQSPQESNEEDHSRELPEQPNGEGQPGEPPEQPNGEAPSLEPSEKPSGQLPEGASEKDFPRDNAQQISISDISEGDAVRVMFSEDGSTQEITIISAKLGQTEESSQII